MALTKVEFDYQANLKDIGMLEFAREDHIIDHDVAAVGAGIGGGYLIWVKPYFSNDLKSADT
eukprot:CAMPEP_0172489026 /NCGR_PEP_ID=MMETSP1066-20121228/18774_1 /TAXON_ID=671091 /ORGANISM="Coscinodiscus wailesii, Strain CCMP2513" /LENGTH=61 /DNA_ID=CAMNT_0013256601 /DNA_START=156 /DNA_END=341 /DNA_ORIENTATION=-